MKRFSLAITMTTALIVPAHAQIRFNPNQVGILRWYKANRTTTHNHNPLKLAFDGSNMWVVNITSSNVMKLSSNGTILSVSKM